jgi:hypothetical protein
MKSKINLLLGVLVLSFLLFGCENRDDENAVDKGNIENSIVFIEVYDYFGELIRNGTGVAIEGASQIITARQVVDDAFKIKVYNSGGKSISIEGIGFYDESSDVTVIKVKGHFEWGASFSERPISDNGILLKATKTNGIQKDIIEINDGIIKKDDAITLGLSDIIINGDDELMAVSVKSDVAQFLVSVPEIRRAIEKSEQFLLIEDDSYYEGMNRLVTKGRKLKVKHILITLEDKTDAEAKELIYKIIGLLDDGEDFSELAREYSDCGSSVNGGELDWFSSKMMIDDFEKAAYYLQNGMYNSEPVKTLFGYHIILKIGER